MGGGQLPKPNAKRRNKPTFAPAILPADGYQGPIPDPPAAIPLGEHGKQWWMWVWRTPQASQFNNGHLYSIAHRARLEDRLAEAANNPNGLSALLRALTEARQFDDRLGLSPKSMLHLRWSVRASEGGAASADEAAPPTPAPPSNVRRLKVT